MRILSVSQMPASPPRFGAQVRIHGLLTELARRHELVAAALCEPGELEASREAMSRYCAEACLVPAPPAAGARKRLLQLASLASPMSYERLLLRPGGLQRELDRLHARHAFDVVLLEFPFLSHLRLRGPGDRVPLVLDEHNVEFDILRQTAEGAGPAHRRLYHALSWKKLRREEVAAWRGAAGVALCSDDDERVVLAEAPGTRTAVVPNAVDPARHAPAPGDPAPDGETVLFFGALNYHPNTEGVRWFLEAIWPRIAAANPRARLVVAGPRPPEALLAHRGPRVEVPGFVEDLRPLLARAQVVVAPLRIGGGTRLKILEAMSMAKAVVSTRIGAAGLSVRDRGDLLLEDGPGPFADAVLSLLADPARAATLGHTARETVVASHSWAASARRLEALLAGAVAGAAPGRLAPTG